MLLFQNLKGNKESWGVLAKIFHWSMAIFVIFQICIGINLHYLHASIFKGELIFYHKIIGTFILALIFFRLFWKFLNNSPNHQKLNIYHKIISNIVHILLYTLLIIIPIQGMILTWLGGGDVLFLGLFKLPRLIEEDFILYEEVLSYHFMMTILITILFFIHLSATLLHIFIYKDKYNVWRSMSFLNSK